MYIIILEDHEIYKTDKLYPSHLESVREGYMSVIDSNNLRELNSSGEWVHMRSEDPKWYKDENEIKIIIDIQYKKGEVEYYHSSIRTIGHYNFLSENEVILANAIYENTKEDFNHNTFVQELKFVFRVLGINSVWTD